MEIINHPHLAEHILRAVNDNRDGIQIDKLEERTKLSVETRNSVYEMVILDNESTDMQISVELSGGTLRDGETRYEDSVRAFFVGSTFGGSLLQLDWIGKDMCMEFFYDGRVLVTSPVENVEIEAPDGSWNYSLDWNNEDQD